jgi:hypothetical protein
VAGASVNGKGPVSGTFAVVVNAPGNSSVHVPDLPLLTGTFSGTNDLSPASPGGAAGQHSRRVQDRWRPAGSALHRDLPPAVRLGSSRKAEGARRRAPSWRPPLQLDQGALGSSPRRLTIACRPAHGLGPRGEPAARRCPARVHGPEPRAFGSAPCTSCAVTRGWHPCSRAAGGDGPGELRSRELGGGHQPRRSMRARHRRG